MMIVAAAVVMRRRIVRVARNLVAIASDMVSGPGGQLKAADDLGRVRRRHRETRPQREDEHQAGDQGERLSHRLLC